MRQILPRGQTVRLAHAKEEQKTDARESGEEVGPGGVRPLVGHCFLFMVVGVHGDVRSELVRPRELSAACVEVSLSVGNFNRRQDNRRQTLSTVFM